MDNNDSNPKSPQTGGLKLMTVFIFVLALHVLVIGGFTVYHLMSGSSDADLALDKTHKLKSDGTMSTDSAPTDTVATTSPAPSSAAPEKTTGTTPAPAVPIPAPAPNPETQTSAPEPAAAPVTPAIGPKFTPLTPTPLAPTAVAVAPKPATPPVVVNKIIVASAPNLAPPPDSNSPSGPLAAAPTVSTPATMPSPVTAPLAANGPVHMPAVAPKPTGNTAALAESPAVASMHKDTYTVKITDSYKKIAHAHHITVAELKAANHIKGDTLHTGQKLVIPVAKTALARSDAADQVEPVTASLSEAPAASSLHHHVYTVEKGDTIAKIAHKFKTTKAALISENNLTGTAHLAVGRKLKIPAKETRSAGTAVPAPSAPSQVQMAPVAHPAPSETPAPTAPSAPSPELANMTF